MFFYFGFCVYVGRVRLYLCRVRGVRFRVKFYFDLNFVVGLIVFIFRFVIFWVLK